MKAFRIILTVFLGLLAAAAASDKNASNLEFTVLKASNSKPVRNASIVLHKVDKDGHQSKAGVELKTDADGKTNFDGAPYGKLRVQVLAPGFQTFGQDYEINQPQHEIVIKLKRPSDQYTIYK
jgi:hypothetical protein